MQKSPYAGVINTLVRSESEAGREESRASVCYASRGRKGSMAMNWQCRSWIVGKRRIDILRSVSGLPATCPVEFLETGGEKTLRHNGLTGNSPFPREKMQG